MKIQHLISTMERMDFDFLKGMNLSNPCVIVNQNQEKKYNIVQLHDSLEAEVYSVPEVGLSNSRNTLLQKADADVCVLCDDDVTYLNGYDQAIRDAYTRHKDADIIVFTFGLAPDDKRRIRSRKDRRLHLWDLSRVASVEVSFKLDRIRNKGLKFDPALGLGSRFPSGEENAFLANALRSRCRIYYVPRLICYTSDAEREKPDRPFDDDYFETKGAVFDAIYKNWFYLHSFVFLISKNWTLFRETPLRRSIICMLRGRKLYREGRVTQKDAK